MLGLLSVLMLMGVAFSVTMRTERGGASNMRHAAMARHTLDSAIARTMADLDSVLRSYSENGRFYANSVPEDMVVLASGENDETTPVNLLSHEISRHLPSDQLAAALYTNAHWRPIYGDIRISDVSDADPTSEDSPVGRYAYIVLNGCGNLDPNFVGRKDRQSGVDPEEIQLGESDSSRVLNNNANGTVASFRRQLEKDGHYVNMRDFLRKGVTNIVKYSSINVNRAPFPITTNSFAIGSMALDDPAPPIEINGEEIGYYKNSKGEKAAATAVAFRPAKFSLVDKNGKLRKPSTMSSDDITDMAEAFYGAFYSTWTVSKDMDDSLPTKYPYRDKLAVIPCEQVAARILLDAMDDDIYPGGHTGHSNENESDGYLKNRIWSHLPCTEPVPMLDNVFSLGSLKFKGFAHRQVPDENGAMVDGVATAAVWTVSISIARNSSLRYVGWTVPSAAVGTYDHEWTILSIGADLEADFPQNVNADVKAAFIKAFDNLRNENFAKPKTVAGSMKVSKGINGGDRRGEHKIEQVFSFEISLPMASSLTEAELLKPNKANPTHNGYNTIPESFGLHAFVVGRVSRGGKLLQIAPAPVSDPDEDVESNSIYLDLVLDKEAMKDSGDNEDEDSAFLGAAFCLDPMFAYRRESWVPTSGFGSDAANSPIEALRAELTKRCLDSGGWMEDIWYGRPNPLTRLYLSDPTRKFGGRTLFQILVSSAHATFCGSDLMWANPDGVHDDSDADEEASLAFYLDPETTDEEAPERFNRVGQLGFLPIGPHRTIALLDGFNQNSQGALVRTPRQRVLDYFTMTPPRDEGTEGTDDAHPGKPVKSGIIPGGVNINPPRAVCWKKTAVDGTTKLSIVSDDYNLLPITAVLTGCPLREWGKGNNRMPIDWSLAEMLAEAYAENLDRSDDHARTEDVIKRWNSDGIAHDISVLGRCGQFLSNPTEADLRDDPSWDSVLRQHSDAICDFDREGVVRNSAGLFTARQQLFTILLKADSFTPKFGYEKDAAHGTSLASVQAIVHVWRDPEPLRDKTGYPIRDRAGNAIHPYVVLDVYQF